MPCVASGASGVPFIRAWTKGRLCKEALQSEPAVSAHHQAFELSAPPYDRTSINFSGCFKANGFPPPAVIRCGLPLLSASGRKRKVRYGWKADISLLPVTYDSHHRLRSVRR